MANIPGSRTYTHLKCRGKTTVSDSDFEYVSHVFSHPDTTLCATCDNYFAMEEFCWTETDERLTDFYARHASKYSSRDHYLCSGSFFFQFNGAGLFLGALAGLAIGLQFGWLLALLIALAGGGLGAFISNSILNRIIASINTRVLGVSDYRMLR